MKIQIIVYAIVVTSFVQVSFAQDVNIITKGANSTVIEVTPDSLGVDTVKTGGVSYLDLLYNHTMSEMNSQGYYLKRFIPVMVGVFSKEIRVQVLQTDYQTRTMMQPMRSPRLFKTQPPITASEFVSYNAPQEQRRHFVSLIRVYPFLYDSLSGSYRIMKRVVFQIVSVGTEVTNQAGGTDRLLSKSLINYSQVQNAVVSGSARLGVIPNQLQKVQASSVLAQGPWYSLAVSQSGIYKLAYQNLKDAKIPVDSIHLNTVRIFNNGGTQLPEDPNASRPIDLTENAVYVYNGNTDGTDKFESGDYVLFYGKSPREWSYDPSSKTFSHYLNNYTEINYYFMTYGGQAGKRMQTVQSYHSSSYYIPQNFTCGIAADSELNNLQGSGKDWYGAELEPSSTGNPGSNVVEYLNKLNGLDPTQNITYKVRLVSRSDQDYSFSIYENSTNTLLGQWLYGATVDYNADDSQYAYAYTSPDYTGTGNLPSDLSTLRFVYSCPNSTTAQGYIDWFEIFYKRKFQALNDVLNFYAPDTSASVYYSVQGFSSNNAKVFDVTDFANVNMVQPDSISNGDVSFGIQTTAGTARQLFAVGDKGYLTVGGIAPIQNSDLRGQLTGADLIIVSPPDFISQANQLASIKESFDGLKTVVVKTTDIYNEFGCGIPDPTAIRDYLKFAYSNDQQVPSYVILFGSGTYDYKNKVADVPEYVPPYESDESLDQVNSFSSDDYFVLFNNLITDYNSTISMSIGRLPARSQQDATTMVNKIQQYEQNPNYGSWRNLVTFVADDHNSNSVSDVTTNFTDDSKVLAEDAYTPPDLDRQEIYLGLYPTIVSTQGIRKPDAATDLINKINQGTLVVNFIGHGAPNVWSYTHIFENEVAIPQLTNSTTLTLLVAATCDFGRDDDPHTGSQSGAELLVLSPQGGAIGALSSTRVTYEGDNSDLNRYFFQDLFVRDSLRNPSRIGDAFFSLKQTFGIAAGDLESAANDIKYNYIGDPTVRLALPKYQATIDSLNGESLAIQTQQIRALDKLDVKGTVYHPDKTVWSDFNGTALLTIFDSDKNIPIPEFGLFILILLRDRFCFGVWSRLRTVCLKPKL